MKKSRSTPSQPEPATAARTAWALAVLLVLWGTLIPFEQDLSLQHLASSLANIQWIPFVEKGRLPLWSDVLGNLALFIPFGLAGWACLSGRRRRVPGVLGSAAALSLLVEVVQLALPARRTSATDLVTDVIGALAGSGIGRLWESRGQDPARDWTGALVRGETAQVFVALFAVCLAVWAVFPGHSLSGGVWRQLQVYSSSFRRFPTWGAWAAYGMHPFLLGGLFGALATRSAPKTAAPRWVLGALATAVLGVTLETIQLVAPSRRPEIFQALAFGLGGIPGSFAARAPRWLRLGLAGAAFGAGILRVPWGDSGLGETWSVLLLGAILVAGESVWSQPSRA